MITFGDLPTVPSLSARVHVQALPNEGVAYIGESGGVYLETPSLHQVSQLIDGRRTSREIVGLLAGHWEPSVLLEALATLTAHGLIGESAGLDPGFAAVWAELGVDEVRASELLDATVIGIVALDGSDGRAMAEALGRLGIATVGAPASQVRTLDVVLVEDFLDPRLGAVNDLALRNRVPWLAVKPTGINLWVGPVFTPGEGACWECLRTRLRHNRPLEDYLHRTQLRSWPVPVVRDRTGAFSGHAYTAAASRVVRWLTDPGERQRAPHSLEVIEGLHTRVTTHTVVRRPQCSSCGDPSSALPVAARPEFKDISGPVISRDGGEHRETPAATFARYSHLISPVTGLVSAVMPSPWNSMGPLRSFSAGHNHALSNDTFRAASDGLRSWSSGKGRSEDQARASALCEALERLSGMWTGEEPRIHASFDELADSAVDPRDCLLFSVQQYEERARWAALASQFQMVPEPFRTEVAIDWSPLWSLTQNRVRYLPSSYLFFGYPHDHKAFFAWPDSNGNAAGATLADACLQGLYELVERDAVALWWYNRVPRPAIDLDSLDDPWVGELRAFYRQHDREFWALDLTSDLGIPVVAAVSQRLQGPTSDIVMGFGAHHDLRLAASRALTEMNQFMPAVLDILPDGQTSYGVQDRLTLDWWRAAQVDAQPHLRPLRWSAATPVLTAATDEHDSAYWFERGVHRVEQHGHEVLLLDQTRPDIGLPVAKVVAPGLRHFWARLAPGRLYDVPVTLGWLPEPLAEHELNPIPMFL